MISFILFTFELLTKLNKKNYVFFKNGVIFAAFYKSLQKCINI